MSCVNEPPGIQESQTNDAKDSTKLTNGVNDELRRSSNRRSSRKTQNDQPDIAKLSNGTVNPAYLNDADEPSNNKEMNSDPPNPNYVVNGGHPNGVEPLSNGTARVIIPEDAVLNNHSGRIRLKKKEDKENETNDKKNVSKDKSNSGSVVIPMNGVLHNGHLKEKGEKETTMTVPEKVKDGVPVSSPLTSEKNGPKKSTLEEYFIPANTHKKFLRGEKLYLTNEKRKGGCSRKKVAISACLLAVLAAAVLIGVLAATGILPAGQSEMLTASSPSLELPAQASVSMRSHDDTLLPLTSSAPTVRVVSTPSPRRTTVAATRQPSSATIATNLVNQLPIVTTQAPVIVPNVLKGQLSVVNRNFSDSLNDQNSDEYERMRTELETELKKVFNDTRGFIKVNVTNFQQGSIKVQFVTSFLDQKYDPREIQKVIQAYLDKHNGYLNEFLIDPKSIAVQIPKNECDVENGGCSDFCNWDSLKYLKVCSCYGHKILQNDQLTCLLPTKHFVSSPSEITTEASSTTIAPETPSVTEQATSTEGSTAEVVTNTTPVTEMTELETTTSADTITTVSTTTTKVSFEFSLPETVPTTTTATTTTTTEPDTTLATIVLETTTQLPSTDIPSTVVHPERGEGRSFTGNDTVTESPEVINTATTESVTMETTTELTLNVSDIETTATDISCNISGVESTEKITVDVTETTPNQETPTLTSTVPTITTSEAPTTVFPLEEIVNSTTGAREVSDTSRAISLETTTMVGELHPVTTETTPTTEVIVTENQESNTSIAVLAIVSTTTTFPDVTEMAIVGENNSVSETPNEEANNPSTVSTVPVTTTLFNDTTTENGAKQAENTRAQRNSESTPSDFNTFITEVITPTENGTILNSILQNETANSTNDLSTELGDEIANVNTEVTPVGEETNSTDIVDLIPELNATQSENSTDKSLTTESLLNDTLVDEFALEEDSNLTTSVPINTNGTTVVIDDGTLNNETTVVIDDGTLNNETTEYTMLNITNALDSTISHQELTSISPENFTYDVVSISGRRLDDDTNSTFTYDDDSVKNATAYDGLIFLNETDVLDNENATSIEDSYRFDNETIGFNIDMLNDTTVIDDILNSTQPQMTNASFIEGCSNEQFRCSNDSEECLSKYKKCDGITDCPDGFDEHDCLGSCESNFLCTNSSECVKIEVRCDGVIDCVDGSDEEECGGKAYCDRIQQVSCSDNSYCIKPLEICDGHYNCLDKSDERDCVDRSACQASGSFFCNDGLCLPPGLRCDGSNDCKQGEDEADCKCKEGQFRCTNGVCISNTSQCNGAQDCSDGSDEMECVKIDFNGVVQIFDAPSNSWGLLCNDPDIPWTLDGGHELCQELGFSSAESVGHLKVYTNISLFHQWVPRPEVSNSYWLANAEARNNCNTDSVATLSCVKYECGDLKHEDGRRKKVEQWPFMATVSGENGHHICRAEILTPLWLITSVGCLKQLPENYTNWLAKVQQVELLSSTLSSNLTQERKIKSVISHPHSSIFRSRILYDYDMAMVRLAAPLRFDHNMAAVCLPDEEVKPGITCFTSSFTDPNIIDPVTHKAKIKYIPLMVEERDTCNKEEHYNGGVGTRMLCTKSDTLCEKDDAATLACISIDEKWYLAGLLSYQRYCGAYKAHPAVYTNVFPMRGYIEKVVGMKMYNSSDSDLPYSIQINHDASYIDGADLSQNSVRPLEPYSAFNGSDNITRFDDYYNSTDFIDNDENGTLSSVGADPFTMETTVAGSRNESESVGLYVPGYDDNQGNDTGITPGVNDTVLIDSYQIENENSTLTNASTNMLIDGGSLNSIVNDTETFDNETSWETIGVETETTTIQHVPKPILVYDSESTATEVDLENSTGTTLLPTTLLDMNSTSEVSTSTPVLLEVNTDSIVPITNETLETTTKDECDGDVFKCLGGPACIPLENVCDGDYHCPDQSDEWSCVRINQSTSVVEIRHHSFGWSPICSDGWTGDLSHKACNQLGYMSALLTDHIPLVNQSDDMLLQVKDSSVRLVQGAVSANESEVCAKNEMVAVTCSEFQCGLWSLKSEESHTSDGRQGRTVGSGGTSSAARDGEWPSMAILKNGGKTCSASILSKRWLVASWSCLRDNDSSEPFTPSNWTAVTATASSSEDELGPSVTKVDTIIPHPSANGSDTGCEENDVALIRLSSSLGFGRFASAVCLPQRSFRPRELCVVAVWEKQDNRASLYYQPVNTLVTTENECNSTNLETDDTLCAGLIEGPTYTQQNEPGAALMCINRSHHWELHGIVSAQNNCHRNVTYTNVYSHSKWIASTIKEN